jgi:large subunit ribosomal protein L21
MYAIIQSGGKQFWVTPGETVQVDKLDAKEGQTMTLDALWAAGGSAPSAGDTTSLPKAKVIVEVIRQLRGPRIIVFKKRTKKAYQKWQGHRQDLTEIRVKEISLN